MGITRGLSVDRENLVKVLSERVVEAFEKNDLEVYMILRSEDLFDVDFYVVTLEGKDVYFGIKYYDQIGETFEGKLKSRYETEKNQKIKSVIKKLLDDLGISC